MSEGLDPEVEEIPENDRDHRHEPESAPQTQAATGIAGSVGFTVAVTPQSLTPV
jgi:hypothetical protein